MDLSRDLDGWFSAELSRLEQNHLLRKLRVRAETTLNFAANDYLGLSRHPALIAAAEEAVSQFGTGAGASRLISGTNRAVLKLEEDLAVWKEKASALTFSSGFAAAMGTIPALVGKGDVVVLDKLSHACLIDASKLSGATLRVYPHNNMNRLDAILRSTVRNGVRVLVVTESVFSMDGDAAHLPEIVELKNRHGAWLLVDEAHATGLYGPSGAGLISALRLSDQVEIIMGTFSKALGSSGGYMAGSRILMDALINRARSFIYSTAPPPGVVAANHAGLILARTAEGAKRRIRLWKNVACFLEHLKARSGEPNDQSASLLSRGQRAIQPIPCYDEAKALEFSARLHEEGIFIPAIRYPTVPKGQARLRLALSASHTRMELEVLDQALRANQSF